MREIGLSRLKWTSPGWPGLALGSATTGAMPRVWPSSQVRTRVYWSRPPLLGDGSETATCPVNDVHIDPDNVGVTEDRG